MRAPQLQTPLHFDLHSGHLVVILVMTLMRMRQIKTPVGRTSLPHWTNPSRATRFRSRKVTGLMLPSTRWRLIVVGSPTVVSRSTRPAVEPCRSQSAKRRNASSGYTPRAGTAASPSGRGASCSEPLVGRFPHGVEEASDAPGPMKRRAAPKDDPSHTHED